MKQLLVFLILLCPVLPSIAQVFIEPNHSKTWIDPKLVSRTGYLVVPENRNKPKGRKIKIPFLFVRRPEQDPRKNILLFTTGGPGFSTIANMDSISYNSDWLEYGGFIAFDQRGTKLSSPCLDCQEVYEAIRQSYRDGKDYEKLLLEAVRNCRARLVEQDIDLSAYNTIESAEDINDLRLVLQLDSLNLLGISYSGGLMLTVARNHPEAVRSLILNSPLPGFVNFEEHALLNCNEALEQVFADCEKDSTDARYLHLRTRFRQYFGAISDKTFSMTYQEKPGKSYRVTYTKNELLRAIIGRLNTWQVESGPSVMVDIISGKHEPYVKEVLDGEFEGNDAISLGMRYSVYCSEQVDYASEKLQKQQDAILPWLSGYRFNDVDHPICSCWQVKPEPPVAKTPVYSAVPALIVAGGIDPDCRPFYNDLIKRYLPNAQLLIVHNRGHLPGFAIDGVDYAKLFMEHPYQLLVSQSKNLIIR